MPRPASDLMLHEVAVGHLRARVEIISTKGGQTLLSTNPNSSVPRMLVVGGTLVNDEARNYPGSGTLEVLIDEATKVDVLPITGSDPFAPTAPAAVQVSFYPHEFPDLPQAYGRFEVSKADVSYGSDGMHLSVEMFDNSRKVDNARFWKAESAGPASYELILNQLLTVALPTQSLVFTPYPNALGLHSWDPQDSRLSAVNEIVTSIGFQLDWNYNGVGDVRVWPNPGVATTPDWRFIEGTDLKVVSANRDLSDEKAYNGVIASGDNVSSGTPPVTAEAWDLNTQSPTYFDPANPSASLYGPKPFFYTSQFIATQQQAQDAANARLPSVLGMTEVVSFETLPHPGIIPGDVIEIDRPNFGFSGLYVVESIELPLTTSNMMTVTCRERRSTTGTT